VKRAFVFALVAVVSLAAHAVDMPVITVLDFKVDGVSEKEMKSLISTPPNAIRYSRKWRFPSPTAPPRTANWKSERCYRRR
jgi:hypothetical protein